MGSAIYMREVCADEHLKNPGKIGGDGLIVEIDESLFSRRKYNRGNKYPSQGVSEGVRRDTKEVFLVAVPDRTVETLMRCLEKYVE